MQCFGRGADISSGKVIIHPAQSGVLYLLGWVEKRESQETKNPWLVRMDDDLTTGNICSPASTLHSLDSWNWRLDTGLLKEGRYEFRWFRLGLKPSLSCFLSGQTLKNGKQIVRGCQNFPNISHTWKQIQNMLIF